ncbi:hypothetical protein WR25_06909 isoform B [Diploscapter pachys]|uniref:Persulfide dioxygenase ETHE1, mitochondrial n=1 Tax=Diploscapter pachys TaxID=2018661 RepID=A0A2A2L4D1_9BILA|nr:hypothetical protein WR25_06909 isoform B [Diploscapter pachys]
MVKLGRFIFRQLVEYKSNTYTYILGCPATRQSVIIDPVVDTAERDARLLKELELDPIYGLNTHVHADHVTGTHALKQIFPHMKAVLSDKSGGKADKLVKDGEIIKFGEEELEIRSTPGHTNGCVTYVSHKHKMAFTGDALLVRGCGRTDFQQGNPRTLYKSVWKQIFSLPDDYDLFVGHNYVGVLQTSVAEEKALNPRLTKSEDEFAEIMNNLNLPNPKQMGEIFII